MIPSTSRSEFLRVRGLRYHIRRWGDPGRAMVFLGHGFLDVSASFEPLVAALLEFMNGAVQVLAPDWRGFGHSDWARDDGYWFYDYVGDFEAIATHYSPDAPLTLIGHSMAAQILSLYSGLRPARVAKLVVLDGLALPDMAPALGPARFRRWLDQLQDGEAPRSYPSFEDLAGRVRRQHPQLSDEQALFVARCWGREDGFGRITLCADPRHKRFGPGLYHSADSEAIWREVSAKTFFLEAGNSDFLGGLPGEQMEARRACFRDRERQVIPGAGHMLHFDAPRETARRIANFLQRA
jgi:pimeloyl-ACP methyl ester carboxylesterase